MSPPARVSPVAPTRERLIGAATALVRRRGVAGTGVGEICQRAGVTKGVFSHHFPGGKEELVVEVIERNRADVSAALSALAQTDGRRSGEVVQAAFRAYADLLRTRGLDFGCPVAASVVDASSGSVAIRQATADTFARWSAELDRALGSMDVGQADLVVAALEGAILQARAAADPSVLERAGATLAALLAR